MFFFDWTMILMIPGLLLGMYAQYRLKSLFAKYHDVPQSQGLTGAEVAQKILRHEGIDTVIVEQEGDGVPSRQALDKGVFGVTIALSPGGELSDHYDPTNHVLRLSQENFHTSSIASIGVAAHEAGHAIQHKEKYFPLDMRMAVVGVTNFASSTFWIIFLVGMIFHQGFLLRLGIWLFSAVVGFQLITLPVEFDASARAKRVLADLGLVNREEGEAIKKMLGAAALTYVAGLVSAVFQLLRLILIANGSRSRD